MAAEDNQEEVETSEKTQKNPPGNRTQSPPTPPETPQPPLPTAGDPPHSISTADVDVAGTASISTTVVPSSSAAQPWLRANEFVFVRFSEDFRRGRVIQCVAELNMCVVKLELTNKVVNRGIEDVFPDDPAVIVAVAASAAAAKAKEKSAARDEDEEENEETYEEKEPKQMRRRRYPRLSASVDTGASAEPVTVITSGSSSAPQIV